MPPQQVPAQPVSFSTPGERAESTSPTQASLNGLYWISRQLTANTWLLHAEAWEENSLYPANRQMQWNNFRKMTNHAQI